MNDFSFTRTTIPADLKMVAGIIISINPSTHCLARLHEKREKALKIDDGDTGDITCKSKQ